LPEVDDFADYQSLTSLQEYVLISQKRQRLECFRRNSEGLWVLYTYKAGEKIHLESINFQVDIDQIYEDVILTSNQQEKTV
jgi:Uma2 family endonuclease